jgi:Ssp1 endopeptidase immunity protein Rap1a
MPQDGSRGGRLPDYVCVPGPTTGPQLRESYVSWLRRHPEAQRQTAAQAAVRALNDTYVCPGEQRRQ